MGLSVVKLCEIEGCTGAVCARGLCRKHYMRGWRLPDFAAREAVVGCAVAGCNKPHEALGLCAGHYSSHRYRGMSGSPEFLASERARNRVRAEKMRREPAGREERLSTTRRWDRTPSGAAWRRAAAARRRTLARGIDPAGIQSAIDSGMANLPCARCAAPGPSHIDHIIPLSWADGCPAVVDVLGEAWAYQPLCASCNATKRHLRLECYVPTGDIG